MSLRHLAAAATFFAASACAHAGVVHWSFTGYGADDGGVATLTLTDIAGGVEMRLQTLPGFADLGSDPHIGHFTFRGPAGNVSLFGGESVDEIEYENTPKDRSGYPYNWEIGYDRFLANEWSVLQVVAPEVDIGDFYGMVLKVSSARGDGVLTATRVTPAVIAVPEPGGMALAALGLGLLGWTTGRPVRRAGATATAMRGATHCPVRCMDTRS